jgi:hypothetical protein
MQVLVLLFAALLAPIPPACFQEEPPPADEDPKEKKKREREENAAAAFTNAKKLFEEGKFEESQTLLRSLRSRFFDTQAYLENREEIETMVTDCGYKIAAAGLATVKINKKEPHVDTILGFRVFTPEGWRGIPNWQELFGSRDTSEAKYAGQSYRIARYTSRWMENIHMEAYKVYAPGSVDEVVEGMQKYWIQFPYEEGLKKTEDKDFNGMHKGKRVLYVDGEGNRIAVYGFMENKKGFGLACYWVVEDRGGFFRIRGGGKKARPPTDEEWTAAVKVFDDVAKTAFIMDQLTLSQMRGSAKTWGINPDGWCVKCSDWGVHQTERYTIEYQTKREFAQKLGKELEQIYRLYQMVIPSAKTNQRCRVKLFDTEEDFQYYGQAPGAAAYWSPAQEEIVAYRFEGGKVTLDSKEEMTVAEGRTPEQTTFSILYHECFHQYMFYLMGRDRGVYVPSWLNEGMGDYFFGGRWEKGKFDIGINEWRLATILAAVQLKKSVPLDRIIRYTQADYYSNAGLCYAQGWAMNYFFQSPDGKKKGYDQIPAKMFKLLKTSGDWKKATDAAFAGVDLKKVEDEWKTFVLGMEKLVSKAELERARAAFGGDKKKGEDKKEGE